MDCTVIFQSGEHFDVKYCFISNTKNKFQINIIVSRSPLDFWKTHFSTEFGL